jgi:hypothetical protein
MGDSGDAPTKLGLRLGLVALLSAACSGGGTDAEVVDAGPDEVVDATPAPDSAPILTGLDAFCAPGGPYELLFDKLSTCSPQASRANLFGTDLFAGASLEQFCHELFDSLVDDASVSFDDSSMQACLDHVAERDCLELSGAQIDNTPCADLFVGTVATDGDCDSSLQCAGDAFCRPEDAACNSCQDRLATGADCLGDAQCQDGKCNSLGQCAAPVFTGGDCLDRADCAGRLTCDNMSGTCVDPFPQVGDPCGGHAACSGGVGNFVLGLYCQPSGVGNMPGSCELLPEAGQACGPAGPGGQGLCNFLAYVWCDPANDTCTEPSVSALGEPCNALAVVGSGARQCASGLTCTSPTGAELGSCVATGYEGDSCTVLDMGSGRSDCHPSYDCVDSLCEGTELISGLCPAP